MFRKTLSLVLVVAVLSLMLTAPVWAGRGGGGFHGGSHHGGFHHGGFHRGCCWGPAFVGGVFVGGALAYPYFGYPASAYPSDSPVSAEPPYPSQTQVAMSPSIQRDVCYSAGCYRLRGDGVTIPYSWVWVPAAPALPPGR